MLKRQRPATPPPSSLGDPPPFLPDGPIRPLQPLHTVDPSQPRSKRQRTQPPPLEGALRGWLDPKSTGLHWESDGEEDWVDDAHTTSGSLSLLLPSTTASQYKDANTLLHGLHVLNQHRLLFAHSSRDEPLNSSPLHTAHTQPSDPKAEHRPAPWSDRSPSHSAFPQFTRGGFADRSCSIGPIEVKGLVEEVQCVRQRYEGTNRLLGSLFLSRRREVEGMAPSADTGPSG